MNFGIRLAEAGRLPDFLLRAAIRFRHRAVLQREDPGLAESKQDNLRQFIQTMKTAPVAPAPLESNQQHYEVPSNFFRQILGPRLKYSACLWPEPELGRRPKVSQAESERILLSRAEEAMLELTADRASIRDGLSLLDLGCGWGSFSLWAAERFPNSPVMAVSNSKDQGQFIQDRAKEQGLENLRVMTADMNEFQPPKEAGPFDRIVSVEMFEHMGNWPKLLGRIAQWLTEDGLFFLHVFANREIAYPFRIGPDEWMSKHFFAGGMMPADSLALHLQHDLIVLDHWRISGLHYARTLDSWLSLLDSQPEVVRKILAVPYGTQQARIQLNRWRIFLMACSELFSYQKGNQWLVSHYLMSKRCTL